MPSTSLENSTHALFSAAEKLGLQPQWVTSWGLMRVHIKGIKKYLFMSKTLVNTQISAYLSMNKAATRAILAEEDLPNIPYCLPQSHEELGSFFDLFQPIVLKPTLGQRAKGVMLIKRHSELPAGDLSQLIAEQYIHGPEHRYLVLNDRVIAVQSKEFMGEIYQPQGSRRISFPHNEWDTQLVKIALRATQALDLHFAAVDFKQDDDGKWYILELNSAPALWRFEHPDVGPSVPVSELLLQAVIDAV